jgi:nucleotide-binding universal stress UspA family protein
VLGSHRAVLPGRRLGAVVGTCLQEAVAPVAVVPADYTQRAAGPDDPPRVVVGVDGSASGGEALTWAVEEARRRDADLVALRAWVPPEPVAHPLLASRADWFADLARETTAALSADLDAADTDGVRVAAEVVGELPQVALVARSTTADLVVVGNRGRTTTGRILLGSVSSHVARHAACPIVVVRPPASGGRSEGSR